MPVSDSVTPRFSEAPDADIEQYHSFSVLAVFGAALGVLSAIALTTPALWIVPLAGLICSAAALRQIAKKTPWLVGRKTALAGLCLSLFFGVAAPTDWAVFRWSIDREARKVAETWFDYLRHNQPQYAHQLETHPNDRQPFNDSLLDRYRHDPRAHRRLHEFVNQPIIRTLLVLGDRAKVRYFATESLGPGDFCYKAQLAYAVTLEDAARKPKTFFVAIHLERSRLAKARLSDWQITYIDPGYRPKALGGDGTAAGLQVLDGHEHEGHEH